MPPQAKKPEEHRRAIVNALRACGAASDVQELILDNFSCACKAAREEGYDDCANQVLLMAQALPGYGQA